MGYKVAVCGAAGGIGQPLSLLLKLSDQVSDLRCYDVAPFTPGVACDLSHINTHSTCTGYTKTEEGDGLKDALKDADVVVIPAGVPRKPGMTRDDLFNINAGIVKTLIEGCAEACPKAMILIISNPVNSTVPVAAEVLKSKGCYDPKRVMGVTTLDVCRAKTFVAAAKGKKPSEVNVPVIGGHAGKTIIPLLSQTGCDFSQEEIDKLTHRIMFGGDEVVQAKAGAGSATLSMAHAGAHFAIELMKAMSGTAGIVECCYSENSIQEGCPFFATPCKLGPNGIEEHLPIGTLSAFEQECLTAAVPELNDSIDKGVKFATK
jgi:malate dehydrogenase|uniref:Malate dehydrogenase n=1 Tax=Eutreptiella gymnastica TaxID=73025 RepID=A0A7S4GF60_9EUGL|mmetsp:Transcript_17732/g.30726  ORF Transcript_17732/g.30726 Transcript_17732/m.30726 type:complete len:318 (+) Transcript_17732:30-983(+)|eukprot:CAMPEP_0174284588 /NCGR_PEP_ID=MMETSP0809-20121228/6058_1 /TAXON_ID=73025 ORGANISM="Eutreptiella gymnastica-like, Strain CCMP1594" /NCGR_SAMPLE_ID=MMETSP0809 /ASSEMBLY_ACC=CAM_ASM_000658 /LENGTH=317 /DNA_ID=CAMNT_0015380135 /DNA_START=30 /DNA_END=983 /DNA_ORIENTATION=+